MILASPQLGSGPSEAPRPSSASLPAAYQRTSRPRSFNCLSRLMALMRLSVEGHTPLSACVKVWGDCTVANGAELRVAQCRNVERYGRGGGVFVEGDLHVDGAVEVHQSHTGGSGGPPRPRESS